MSNTATVLRTLNLPDQYSILDGYITDWRISKNLVVNKTIDRSKSVKTEGVNGKITYSNAPDKYSYQIQESRNELTNSGTYLPNLVSIRLNQPKYYLNPDNVMEIKMDRIITSNKWIAANTMKIEVEGENIVISDTTELGGAQNVLAMVREKVAGQWVYKNPKDYLGREIAGEPVYNQGAPAKYINVSFENRLISVLMVTKVLQGTGTWSSSTGVWSNGVKTMTTTSYVLIPVSDLPSLFGQTIEELESELTSKTYCTELPSGHITSTSTEIVADEHTYKGITYYNGLDASVNKPSGQITSYGKTYPGHVQRWILKQWNQDGTVSGGGVYGQAWMKQYQSSEDSTITIVAGNQTSFDEATKTLTYDSSKLTELWYQFEELPAQGKNWCGETIIEL